MEFILSKYVVWLTKLFCKHIYTLKEVGNREIAHFFFVPLCPEVNV